MISLEKNFFYIYIVLLAWQVILLAHYSVQYLSDFFPTYTYDYYQCVILFVNSHKKFELMEYVLAVVMLGIFFVTVLFKREYIETKTKLSILHFSNSPSLILFTIMSNALLPGLMFRAGSGFVLVKIFISLMIFVISIWIFFSIDNILERKSIKKIDVWLLEKIRNFKVGKSFYLLLIMIGYLQLIYTFYEPVFKQPKIITDYFGVNESTYIGENQVIDKSQYLEQILQKGRDNELKDFNVSQLLKNSDSQVSSIGLQLTKEETEFLQKNLFEIHWQIFSRYMFHHNSFMYIPIQELEMQKDANSVNAQYGVGSAWIFSKLFALQGGISFDNWLRFSYSAYYAYFLIFIISTYLLTRNLTITAVIFLLALASVNSRGYNFLILPPGESPWRHFFDLWIIVLLYYFGKTQKVIYYWFALVFSIFSIFINPQIGAMIFVPVVVIGLVYLVLQKKSVFSLLAGILISFVLAMVAFKVSSSANDLAKYYLDGVIGFPISPKQMLYLLLYIVVGYTIILKIWPSLKNEKILPLLFLFLYTQELLLYAVWHYNDDGLKSRAFIYIMSVGVLFYYWLKTWAIRWQNTILLIVSIIAIVIYGKSVGKLLHTKKEYNEIFKTHKTYEWEMNRAHIISTTNPLYFQNSIDLIKKYGKGDNGVYIVSEYDNILPFLADKYSLMPFFDLKWYLVTSKEVRKSIETLQSAKPEFIFVDTNIDRDYKKEVIDPKIPFIGELYQESVWRVERLILLKTVFDSVKNEYELAEKGTLISVYKRKNLNETN